MITRLLSSYWVSKGLTVFLSQLSGLVFGFLNFYFLLRILTKYDYGVWTLFISILTFFELVKNGFVINPLVRYLIDSNEQDRRIVSSSSFLLNCLIALCQILVTVILSLVIEGGQIGNQLNYLLLIMVVAIILIIPLTHFNGIQQANMNFRANLFSNLTRQFVFFVFVLILYLSSCNPSLHLLGVAYLFSVLLSVCIAYLQSRKYGSLAIEFNRDWLIKLLVYGKFTFGTNVSSMILRSIDTWLIGAILSPSAVTIYNPAIRIANIIEVPTISLSTIFFPKLLSRYTEEGADIVSELYEKSVGVLLAILLPVVLLISLFADSIVLFVAGEGFEETVNILRITMLSGLIIPFNRQIGIMLDAVGKAKLGFYFVLRNALINVLLGLLLIQCFGIIGASYAMLITFIFSFIYNQWYVSKHYGIKLSRALGYSFIYYRVFFDWVVKGLLKR